MWFLAGEHRLILHDNSMHWTDIKAYKLYRVDERCYVNYQFTSLIKF